MEGFRKRAEETEVRIKALEAKYEALLVAASKKNTGGSGDELAEFKKKSLETLLKIRSSIEQENAQFEEVKKENAELQAEQTALKAELAALKAGKVAGAAAPAGDAAPTGDVAPVGDAPLFTINGFYMAMRDKYTREDASIHYYVAEWDSAKLSWKDFRGKVLGATDPTLADPKSLRSLILQGWKELGLSSEPNVGDNGVHASASPFEALAERINWLGVDPAKDEFGKALLKIIPADTLAKWTKDPQVEVNGEKRSLFDSLEDQDAQEVLDKAQAIAGSNKRGKSGKNAAFVFIKPHAVTDAVKSLVRKGLEEAGITLVAEGTLPGKVIEEKQLIDNHYYAIAVKASLTKPADLNPTEAAKQAFEAKFGLSWQQALDAGYVVNALDATKRLGVDGAALDSIWAKAKKADQLVKFGGGFYCGKIEGPKNEKPSSKEKAPKQASKKGADSKRGKEEAVKKTSAKKVEKPKAEKKAVTGSKKDSKKDIKSAEDAPAADEPAPAAAEPATASAEKKPSSKGSNKGTPANKGSKKGTPSKGSNKGAKPAAPADAKPAADRKKKK